ncbi:hypothetical protein GH714_044058 [Hevea brasiliensis]|uniref:Uncharacterized protein n=1 Tax=Hevea brasiliensis TaxID=3981 RepID=A0A6A6K0W7_HEVBR|nr:hypothetical protein GH714_044058 [Hevea brasiliensis]
MRAENEVRRLTGPSGEWRAIRQVLVKMRFKVPNRAQNEVRGVLLEAYWRLRACWGAPRAKTSSRALLAFVPAARPMNLVLARGAPQHAPQAPVGLQHATNLILGPVWHLNLISPALAKLLSSSPDEPV